MILAQLQAAHDLPHWSWFAVLYGALWGFVFGATTMGVFALRLHRLHRFEQQRAGSGRQATARLALRPISAATLEELEAAAISVARDVERIEKSRRFSPGFLRRMVQ